MLRAYIKEFFDKVSSEALWIDMQFQHQAEEQKSDASHHWELSEEITQEQKLRLAKEKEESVLRPFLELSETGFIGHAELCFSFIFQDLDLTFATYASGSDSPKANIHRIHRAYMRELPMNLRHEYLSHLATDDAISEEYEEEKICFDFDDEEIPKWVYDETPPSPAKVNKQFIDHIPKNRMLHLECLHQLTDQDSGFNEFRGFFIYL